MALFWFWLYAIYSLVTRGDVLGPAAPGTKWPLWARLIILMVIYQAAAWPACTPMRRSMSYAFGGPYHGSVAAFGTDC